MSNVIWWYEVCGNGTERIAAFWSSAISVYTHNPDLTQCFQKTVLSWIQCVMLWLCSLIYIPYLRKQTTVNTINKISCFNWGKLVCCGVLCGLCISKLLYVLVKQSHSYCLADVLQHSLFFVTYALAGFITHYEYRKGVHSGGVLFCYWGLTTLLGIIPARSNLMFLLNDNSLHTDTVQMVTFFVSYLLTVCLFICHFAVDLSALPKQQIRRESQTQPLLADGRDNDLENNHQKLGPRPEICEPFWKRVTFIWITSLVIKGYRQSLKVVDLWNILPHEKTSYISNSVSVKWKNEIRKRNYQMITSNNNENLYDWEQVNPSCSINKSTSQGDEAVNESIPTTATTESGSSCFDNKPSIWTVIVKQFGPYYMTAGFLKLIMSLLQFVDPIILGLLITFISSDDPYVWHGYLYVVLLLLLSQTKSIIGQNYTLMIKYVGLRLRSGVIGLVYRKALTLNNASRNKSTIGEMVNLMAVDAQLLFSWPYYIHIIWQTPLTITLAMYFLWQELGPSVLAGLGLMILVVPINAFLAEKSRLLQINQMKHKDQRMKLLNEILNGIKILKLYAWEVPFRNNLIDVREKELKTIQKAQLYSAGIHVSWNLTPFIVALGSFATYTLSSPDHILDAKKAFVSLSLFNIMNFPISSLPEVIVTSLQCFVSIGRINKFLRNTELDPDNTEEDHTSQNALSVQNGYFCWNADEEPILKSINLKIPQGTLVSVVGTVGSGKSSLLSALLGEMEVLSGQVTVKGSLAYVPQQAWIQNNTLQNNILFGNEMEEQFYGSVITSCALEPDLEIFPGGDQVEIGENGINLSGGQKQRVSLARAIYQDFDIYLLDDPLSAVDTHVGEHIFQHVIGENGLLKHKTRLLVTNAVTYLPKTDLIICLKNGRVSEIGSYEDLLKKSGEFASFIESYQKETDMDDSSEASGNEQDETSKCKDSTEHHIQNYSSNKTENDSKSETAKIGNNYNKESKLTEEEAMMHGQAKLSLFVAWIKSYGRIAFCITLCSYGMYLCAQAGANIWLSTWSNDPPTDNGTQNIELRNERLGVYGAIGFIQALTLLVQCIAMAIGTVNSSKSHHNDMLRSIVKAPMSFFDTTPMGRIVNRFAGDMDTFDNHIPDVLRVWMGTFSTTVTTFFIVSYSTPIFMAVMVPMGIFYFCIQRFYIASYRQLKRIESVSRSPIYSHFRETLAGISSIRSFKEQERFIQKSDNLVDDNQVAFYPILITHRWLGITLDLIGYATVFFAGLFAVIQRHNITPGLAGLSITYALQITGTLNVWVRMTSELDKSTVSIERIQEYIDCPKEAPSVVEENTPSVQWPEEGKIQFDMYSTRYRTGLDLVLKDVTFHVYPGEKVGVVGRTGAGKSSVSLSLFRIIEAVSGKIIIDGVDIGQIGLQDLRSRITIIPQDPVLFAGTIRVNIDPHNQYSDEEVWTTLEQAHIKTFVQNLVAGLNYECSEGGENLSVGQRQLICLARALLRKTKILVLDEATAAVDLETDDLIQSTIRSEFKNSSVITIAHRINTVMDYDRIMVLQNGQVIEMDSPDKLLKNTQSVFYSLAVNAGLI